MVTGRLPVTTKDRILEECIMLPSLSDLGVTVGRPDESVPTFLFAVHPEAAYRPTALRFRSLLRRHVMLSHPLECR